jgi:GAF domain-containing protein
LAVTDAAVQVAAGDLERAVEVEREDEVGVLANAFNSMTAQQRDLIGSLEERVAERTAALQQRTTDLEQLSHNLEDAVDQNRRRALRLEASAYVAHAVASVLDPAELLNQVVSLIADRVGFYHVSVFLLDETERYAVLRAANSVGGQRMLARGHRLRVGEQGIVGYVTGTGRPRIALDVGADAVHFANPDLPHTRSEMALPLVARGRILGALDVQSVEPEAFDKEDVGVLQTLADQIAVALDNARLFEESQVALRDVQAVQAQYTRQAWRAFSTQQEARTIEYTRSGVAPLGDQLLPELVLSPVEVVDRVSRVGGAIVTSGGGDGQTPASLVVPLELYGQPIGVLGFQETEPGRVWTEDEIVLAEAAAYEIAQVLERARLFEQTQARARREALTRRITDRIRDAVDVDAMLKTAIQELGQALGAPRVYVRLATDAGGDGE